MPSAADFQRRFAALLGSDDWIGDRALRRALAIHREKYAKATIAMLTRTFPVILSAVGVEAFDTCARGFARSKAIAGAPLGSFGLQFTKHLARWAPFCDIPYLPAIATLELLIEETLTSVEAAPLAPNAETGELELDKPLRLHPAARIRAFPAPVVDLWHAYRAASTIALEEIPWRPQIALINRHGADVEICALDEASFAVLTAPRLRAGSCSAREMAGEIPLIFTRLLIAGAFAQADKRPFGARTSPSGSAAPFSSAARSAFASPPGSILH